MDKPLHSTKLVFAPEYGERDLSDAKDRGYLSHVLVEVDCASLYPVFFYTLDRLRFELDDNTKRAEPFVAETGMIVVSELTLNVMQAAVQRLCDEGYFRYIVPVTQEQIAKSDPFHWPP